MAVGKAADTGEGSGGNMVAGDALGNTVGIVVHTRYHSGGLGCWGNSNRGLRIAHHVHNGFCF